MTELLDPMQAAPVEMRPAIRSAAGRLADEFAGMFGDETIQRFIAESYTTLHDRPVRAYVPLFVERFARDRLRALARVEGRVDAGTPMIVFLCVHNAGRSQMAAGWAQSLAGDAVEVYSGGSDPASVVNPAAVEAMNEVGIDISTEFPKPWTDEVVRAADVIVTMGCGDACPVFPGKRYEDWAVDDPAAADVDAVRPIRDDIGERVRALLAELDVAVRA